MQGKADPPVDVSEPGLSLEDAADLVAALVRSLPKPLRRALTPVPTFADALFESLQSRREESLLPACAEELRRLSGLDVAAEDLQEQAIDAHFRFLIRVVDGDGALLDSGRDIAELQERLGQKAQRRFMDRMTADDGRISVHYGRLESRRVKADETANQLRSLTQTRPDHGERVLRHEGGRIRICVGESGSVVAPRARPGDGCLLRLHRRSG